VQDLRWNDIGDFPPVTDAVMAALAQLGPLKLAWLAAADRDPVAFKETRLRALRSHAIETGIIERLYDVDWGITETLVAEGLSSEVVARTGGVERRTLDIINDQYEALEYVSDAARGDRPFSVGFIRELHQLITRHQSTYDATDAHGNHVTPELLHGEWKYLPNHVMRPNGSILEYCPAERVQDQMESLVRMLDSAAGQHPVIRAAWLHHRFIAIHPFQDGNGRVARALVLLELLKAHFAPIVVGRDVRNEYIERLDAANLGDLEPLIMLFANLERQGMVRQFQAPIISESSGSVLEVARAAAANLADLQRASRLVQAEKMASLAEQINDRVSLKLAAISTELKSTFQPVDADTAAWTRSHQPGQPESTQWHGQLVKLARRHQFYANLSDGSWWTTLTLRLLNERLRLLVAVVKVGSGDTGVASVLIQAERLYQVDGGEEGPAAYEWLFEPTELDQVAVTGELEIDDVWASVDQLIERCLSASIAEFTRSLA
jgi:Fic family protein